MKGKNKEMKNLKEFTLDVKNALWAEHQDYFKYVFGRALTAEKAGLEYDTKSDPEQVDRYQAVSKRGSSRYQQVNRLTLGYNSLGYFITPPKTGLISEEACDMNLTRSDCTDDHIFGVTEIGKVVLETFIESGLDVDYMVDEWLYEHLHYWFECRITKDEHRSDRLARGKHTLEEKENLVHYQEAGIEIFVNPLSN